MSYNHGLKEKKFKERWQKTAEEYRKAGIYFDFSEYEMVCSKAYAEWDV